MVTVAGLLCLVEGQIAVDSDSAVRSCFRRHLAFQHHSVAKMVMASMNGLHMQESNRARSLEVDIEVQRFVGRRPESVAQRSSLDSVESDLDLHLQFQAPHSVEGTLATHQLHTVLTDLCPLRGAEYLGDWEVPSSVDSAMALSSDARSRHYEAAGSSAAL